MTALTREQFLADVKDHVLTVLREDGLYRHLRFKAPGVPWMYFELLTYPGGLVYRGDMGTFVFERTADMLQFFRADDGRINPSYWQEKLTAVNSRSQHPVKAFSGEKFDREIKGIVLRWVRDNEYHTTRLQRRNLWDAVLEEVLVDDLDSSGAERLSAANDFTHMVRAGETFTFSDIWEYDFTEYTHGFLWCCYALVWGIQQYDQSKATPAPAPAEGGAAC